MTIFLLCLLAVVTLYYSIFFVQTQDKRWIIELCIAAPEIILPESFEDENASMVGWQLLQMPQILAVCLEPNLFCLKQKPVCVKNLSCLCLKPILFVLRT